MSILFSDKKIAEKAKSTYLSMIGNCFKRNIDDLTRERTGRINAIRGAAYKIAELKRERDAKIGAVLSASAMFVVTGKAVAINGYNNLSSSIKLEDASKHIDNVNAIIAKYHPLIEAAHKIAGNHFSQLSLIALTSLAVAGAAMLVKRENITGALKEARKIADKVDATLSEAADRIDHHM